jgi:catechol 2,3-dioxygenase-like lactoylglutathione lyase family enzyme
MPSDSNWIVGVDHVQITIPPGAEDEARRFYGDLLCFQEIEKPANRQDRGGLWLQAGAVEIHIGVETGIDRAQSKAHVAYRVHDLAFWRARLTDAGVQMKDALPLPNGSSFEFRDPFGNRVEFVQLR